MKYWLYILQSEKDGSYYVGHTNNLEDRLKRHNEGKSRCARGKGPWKIAYHKVYNSRAEAMKREREIKKKRAELTLTIWLERSELESGRLLRLKVRIAPARIEKGLADLANPFFFYIISTISA